MTGTTGLSPACSLTLQQARQGSGTEVCMATGGLASELAPCHHTAICWPKQVTGLAQTKEGEIDHSVRGSSKVRAHRVWVLGALSSGSSMHPLPMACGLVPATSELPPTPRPCLQAPSPQTTRGTRAAVYRRPSTQSSIPEASCHLQPHGTAGQGAHTWGSWLLEVFQGRIHG